MKYGHFKTLFYGFFKKFEFCQSSDFLKGYKNLSTYRTRKLNWKIFLAFLESLNCTNQYQIFENSIIDNQSIHKQYSVKCHSRNLFLE